MVNRSEAMAKWIRSIRIQIRNSDELLFAMSFRLDSIFWLLWVLFIQIHSDWPSFFSSDIVKIKFKIFYKYFWSKINVFLDLINKDLDSDASPINYTKELIPNFAKESVPVPSFDPEDNICWYLTWYGTLTTEQNRIIYVAGDPTFCCGTLFRLMCLSK